METAERSPMQHKKEQCSDGVPAGSEEGDSPTIERLIEQLDRDFEETQHKAFKAQ